MELPADPPASRLPTVAFGVALLWAVVSPLCTSDAPLSAADVEAVASALSQVPPRTFVLVHPPWRDDALAALRNAGVKADFGLALPADASDGRRPLVVAAWPRAPAPGAVSRFTAEAVQQHGEATLTFFHGAAKPSAPTAGTTAPPAAAGARQWQAVEALRQAEVRVVSPAGTRACNLWQETEQRWVCPGMNEWNHVGPKVLTVDGQPRQCLWAHPVTGATLSIRFPQVPAGTFTLGTALNDGAAGAEGAADVELDITAGGARQHVIHQNAPGWKETRVALSAATDVTLDITTVHDGARHFCIWPTVTP
jgi:hypothetical protein